MMINKYGNSDYHFSSSSLLQMVTMFDDKQPKVKPNECVINICNINEYTSHNNLKLNIDLLALLLKIDIQVCRTAFLREV